VKADAAFFAVLLRSTESARRRVVRGLRNPFHIASSSHLCSLRMHSVLSFCSALHLFECQQSAPLNHWQQLVALFAKAATTATTTAPNNAATPIAQTRTRMGVRPPAGIQSQRTGVSAISCATLKTQVGST